jgi:hypothetical protein
MSRSYETTNRGGVAYGMRLLQQITRAAPEAFYQCVCECEACVNVNLKLPVLPSTEINKHNMRHYSRPSSRLVAETRADAREVSLRRKHTECRTRSTDAGEGTYSSGQAQYAALFDARQAIGRGNAC